MIRGYPANPSLLPGGRLTLHVATDAPRFRVRFYRWADGLIPAGESPWLPGHDAPAGTADQDWHWPAYDFDVPSAWPSAVYIAYLETPGGLPMSLAMDSAAALFVVRGRGASRLLYKLPLATWQAYNWTGGGCFYNQPPRSDTPPGSRVSLRRPGGGIGGETWGAADHYDPATPRNTFAHWDAPFIRWLLRQGYAPAFCTDFDLHDDPRVLDGCRLLLSVGHDEYWSEPMRDAVEGFVGRGGNVAFFGANLCWWRVHVVDEGRAMVCHQGGPTGALDHWWPATGVNRPEDAMSGVSYRHGGGWWDGPRQGVGYIVQDPAHWVFAGCGFTAGDTFGARATPPLVGYECDGAPLQSFAPVTGLAVLQEDAHACGTPSGFRPLAVAPLGSGWQELPAREGHAAGSGVHAAVLGIHTRNGTVFTAGTTDWAQVLAGGRDPAVERITRNVLDGLGGEGK